MGSPKQPATDTNRRMYEIASRYSSRGATLYDRIRLGLGVDFDSDDHLPADLRGTFMCEGIRFMVLSRAEKPSLSRVYMTCPDCGTIVPAGRVYQHRCNQRPNKRQAFLRETLRNMIQPAPFMALAY